MSAEFVRGHDWTLQVEGRRLTCSACPWFGYTSPNDAHLDIAWANHEQWHMAQLPGGAA